MTLASDTDKVECDIVLKLNKQPLPFIYSIIAYLTSFSAKHFYTKTQTMLENSFTKLTIQCTTL